MKENLQEETKELKKFLIIEIGEMVRPTKEEMEELAEPLEGISKFHSIWITRGGKLRGSVLSCNECTISSRCGLCEITEEKKQKKTTTKRNQYDCNLCPKTYKHVGSLRTHQKN